MTEVSGGDASADRATDVEATDGDVVDLDAETRSGGRAGRRSGRLIDEIKHDATGMQVIRKLLGRGVVLAIGVVLLYLMQQRIVDIVSSANRLRQIEPEWIAVMVLVEIISFVCMWALIKQMLPGVSWFVVACSQLVSNSVSRVVPGGAAVGGATLYRMLSVGGVAAPEAASAMAATSVLSNALLFAIPTVAGLFALAGAPVPERLLPAAIVGAMFFVVLMALGAIAIRYTKPLWVVGRFAGKVVAMLGRVFRQDWRFEADRVIEERDRLVGVLGPRWPRAIAAAAGNWAFDYLALIAALYAVGADPRLSLVLLAFAAASVLGMMPFTPGGVGFVEVGLYSTLIISGIGAADAGLATIVYRVVSWLLPVVSGLVAWVLFKAVYSQPRSRDRAEVRARG